MSNFTVIIDNREQKPVLWDKENDPRYPGLKIKWGTLKTGDYSLVGMDTPAENRHSVCIERKSLADLFQSTGNNHDRLEREFERMSEFDHAEIVIEADLRAIFRNKPPITEMNPRAVYRILLAFSQRYGVKVWPCPNRNFAERHIYLTLKRFWDDRRNGGFYFEKK